MEKRTQSCTNCRFFCQEIDPDGRMYYDSESGECRLSPPRDHFVWPRTRPWHWCGQWQITEQLARNWQKVTTHSDTSEEAVLLFRKKSFCKKSGVIVCNWDSTFKKWHDGGDQLFDKDYVTDWMPLPEPPQDN